MAGLTTSLAAVWWVFSICGDAGAEPVSQPVGDQSGPAVKAEPKAQPRFGPGGINLCGPLISDVVIGEVTELVGRWFVYPDTGGRMRTIVTRVTVRVEARLTGVGASSSAIAFDQRGGVVDGIGAIVSHSPGVALGDRSLIFLASGTGATVEEDAPILVVAYPLPPASALEALPAEVDLRELLSANCAANPGGVYERPGLNRWVIPQSVLERNAGTVFEKLLLEHTGGQR